ncbi:MAG: SusD/RagB family nutrient-binding outer membrane lipoprotein [Cytophagales bacterium]|nr:SusD/RagB family nutrient-binding outer membrane lipoprotein [Cytophagales bacterium]
MNAKYFTYIGLLLLMGFGGCTDDFEEINTPKDAVTELDARIILGHMIDDYGRDFQRVMNLQHDLYSQYWAAPKENFGTRRYEYIDDWVGPRMFRSFYERVRMSEDMDKWYGENPAYRHQIAIKEIWMCSAWGRMTDNFGDLAYFGAGKPVSVPYSTQKEIYYDLFQRLDAAIHTLSAVDANTQKNYGSYDRIYGGDADKWKKFGASIRLRLAMRLSNADPAKAKAEVQKAVENGLMASNEDYAARPLAEGGNDIWYETIAGWKDIVISHTFEKYLYNQSAVQDPRLAKWVSYNDATVDEVQKKIDGENNANGTNKMFAGFVRYKGLKNGYNLFPKMTIEYFTQENGKKTVESIILPAEHSATYNRRSDYVDFAGNGGTVRSYLPIMFFSEVKFLLAEAALRGWYSGDAKALYLEGIQASMNHLGVSEADALAYIEGMDPFPASGNEAKLKQIITQKWIANFPNGYEGWADFRRTDYPDHELLVDGPSPSSTVASGLFIKRLRYPDNQHRENAANLPEGFKTATDDRMDKRVWWDVANAADKSADGLMSTNF